MERSARALPPALDRTSLAFAVTTCLACSRENPVDAWFCNACGAALQAERAVPREERKVVTVLFADLVGFTSRAEEMDPEDVAALLGPLAFYRSVGATRYIRQGEELLAASA